MGNMGAIRQGLRGIVCEQDVIQEKGLGMGEFVDPGILVFSLQYVLIPI